MQEWAHKAVEMKEKYNKVVKGYEANGRNDTGAGKKAKKKDTSEEDEEEESE